MSKTSSKTLAVPQSLYPCKDTLDEAISHSLAQLPITDANHLKTIILTYHNTLLQVVAANEQDNGWRTNKGVKSLPEDLTLDTIVEVRFKQQNQSGPPYARTGRAGSFSWWMKNEGSDILSYRITGYDRT